MPGLNINCDVRQGYRFQGTGTTTFGYIYELCIGGQMLAVDQTTNPATVNKPGVVVAVLSNVKWSGGVTRADAS